MDIIKHLHKTVTPAISAAQGSAAYSDVLSEYYAALLTRLADPKVSDPIASQHISHEDTQLYQQIWQAQTSTAADEPASQLAQAHALESSDVEQTIAQATPLVWSELTGLAGEMSVAQFLQQHTDVIATYLPAWASGLGIVAPAVIAAGSTAPVVPIPETTSTPSNPAYVSSEQITSSTQATHDADKGGWLKGLLPIIGLIILGALIWALLRGCSNDTPVAAPVTEQSTQTSSVTTSDAVQLTPASIHVSVDESGNALYACRSSVGSEPARTKVHAAIARVFGNVDDVCQYDVDASFSDDLPVVDSLADVLALLKNVPNASASIVGNTIRLNAADTNALDKLIADTQALLPAFVVEAEPIIDATTATQQSIDESQKALDSMGNQPELDDLVRALNLQIINFEVAKADIPEVNRAVLDKAANILTQLPEARLTIIGHTDNTASAEYNQRLSEQRAAAVKDYLVAQGVDAQRLTTQGMGQTHPIADNATEQGRFRNRRIEFAVTQQDETLATVASAQGDDTPAETQLVEKQTAAAE